jgi:phosphomannomutase
MAINPSIFKAYDIRGVAPQEFTDDVPELVGRALVAMTSAKRVILGRDARTSSPDLVAGVMKGLLACGVEVIDVGLCTTPMFNFAVASDSLADAGIMITASHNPPKYNGMKMVRKGAVPIPGTDIGEGVMTLAKGERKDVEGGSVMQREILPAYIDTVLKLAQIDGVAGMKSTRIVLDCGNGMVGVPLRSFLQRTGILARVLFEDVDCSFPNHEANPVKDSTLVDLQREVVAEGAAFGVAFDGDADRVGFVDERGVRIPGDQIGALIAESLLQKDELVFGDVNAGWAFREAVERAGGKFELTKVGHANIKRAMRERQALVAAELSYHFYYRDFFYVESELLTLLLVLKRYVTSGKKMSELMEPYRKYFASGEVNFTVLDASAVLARVRAQLEGEAVKVLDFDGLRMEFADWWFSLRASNTEPLVRLNVEAKTQERMEEMRHALQLLIAG